MNRVTIILVLMALWIYVLTIFARRKMPFFYFLIGSVGGFMFSFFILEPLVTGYMAQAVCYITGLLGKLTGFFSSYSSYGILFIENVNGPISLYIDFECAGLVEILVFVSLISFFAAYKWQEKILVGLGGIMWVFTANVLRLTIICCIIHYFGNEAYYVSHTIIGRIFFYLLSISLYFLVFTRRQIRNQRVGDFGYND